MAKKKFYITTSIAYTNASPHCGFALEIIQADVLARYHRILDEEVFFLTGTDEHGAKIAKAAEAAGKSPKQFTDEISAKFRSLKQALSLSNDDFIRTTDQEKHWPTARKVWTELQKDIYKKKYEGLYCVGCEAFITNKDLKDGKCIMHQKEPEMIKEENYFFKLSKYENEIQEAIETDKLKIIPQVRKNEMLSFIKKGLKDISFSRQRKDLQWGIPVPDDEDQTIYVWADALTNYLSALGYAQESDKFKKFWPADVHCVGKDILRFHAIIWPGILLSLGLPLPKSILVHGFIGVNNQKMSKSLGNVIDPFELVDKYGTDAVRYFLLREIPTTADGDFTYEKFEKRYNGDLAAGLGNLTARILTMAEKKGIKTMSPEKEFSKETDKTWEDYYQAIQDFKFSEALIAVWDLIGYCDRYIEKQQPWKSEGKELEKILSNLLFALADIAKMLKPFLPETSEKILQQMGTKEKLNIKRGELLFPKL
ncbi:methionine--tRNA ligase [Candidatus Parcubacteria bacterium]|nr:methionine--tRNA ligase [Candidatus Parcubacteria bacterium]